MTVEPDPSQGKQENSSPGALTSPYPPRQRELESRSRSLWKRVSVEIGGLLVWLLIAAGAVAFGLGRWIVATFGYITPDQALLNLQGAGGEGGGGHDLVQDAVIHSVVIPLGLVLSVWVALRIARRTVKKRGARRLTALTYAVTVVALLAVPAAGAWSLGSAVQLKQYLAAGDPSLNLADYYVEPSITNAESAPRPNLILIYLESIENAFGDEEAFGTNMLHSIQESTADWDSVEALDQYPGGGWTMSGIVSTQCGIPLRAPANAGIEGTDTTDQAQPLNHVETESYLSGATCIGDVLSRQGYKNVFLGGAYTTFASKGQYLTEHGYDEIRGREHWEELGETEITEAWGLSDERLFAMAREKLVELEAGDEPFVLTLLTLDTHEPAHLFDYCEELADTPLTDATRCSMKVVADFIDWVKSEGYLENTTVVVVGDHLKFTSTKYSYGEEFTDYPNRTIFNRIWTPDGRQLRVSEIDQLDMFPTILEAMGFELEDGRAGLGVSAYNPDYVFGSLRELSAEEREQMVRSRSTEFYERMWGNDS